MAKTLSEIRDELTNLIADGQALIDHEGSDEGKDEGLKAIKAARMWFGVSEATGKGFDPWAHKVDPAPQGQSEEA